MLTLTLKVDSTQQFVQTLNGLFDLTAKEMQVFCWIVDKTRGKPFIVGKEFKASMGSDLGVTPPNAVYKYVNTLVGKKALIRDGNRLRVPSGLVPPPLPVMLKVQLSW